MNTFGKIKESWWVILSFIFFLNGSGFIYIGRKHNNKNWILEGITYEIPWFFYFIIYGMYGFPSTPASLILSFAIILMLVGIVRSIWVAFKLADVYDNTERYTIQQTALNSSRQAQTKTSTSSSCLCGICIAGLFLLFAAIAIF